MSAEPFEQPLSQTLNPKADGNWPICKTKRKLHISCSRSLRLPVCHGYGGSQGLLYPKPGRKPVLYSAPCAWAFMRPTSTTAAAVDQRSQSLGSWVWGASGRIRILELSSQLIHVFVRFGLFSRFVVELSQHKSRPLAHIQNYIESPKCSTQTIFDL